MLRLSAGALLGLRWPEQRLLERPLAPLEALGAGPREGRVCERPVGMLARYKTGGVMSVSLLEHRLVS